MIVVYKWTWQFLGVCGAIIIVISIGSTISIIVSSNFGITIGGISDILNVFGVVGVFEILIVFSQRILGFFESV